jgi:hypothetical protein
LLVAIVADGHGGIRAAQFVCARLPAKLAAILSSHARSFNTADAAAHRGAAGAGPGSAGVAVALVAAHCDADTGGNPHSKRNGCGGSAPSSGGGREGVGPGDVASMGSVDQASGSPPAKKRRRGSAGKHNRGRSPGGMKAALVQAIAACEEGTCLHLPLRHAPGSVGDVRLWRPYLWGECAWAAEWHPAAQLICGFGGHTAPGIDPDVCFLGPLAGRLSGQHSCGKAERARVLQRRRLCRDRLGVP